MLSIVDHLVYTTRDLEVGIAVIEQILGCPAVPGGRHEDWGTRNALISLGDGTYLEIIGPDPESRLDTDPTLFGIDRPGEPGLATWAAKGTRLTELIASTRAAGTDLGGVSAGYRSLPDGSMLAWELTDPFMDRLDGVVPFLIDWGDSRHPASMLPASCKLVGLALGHPDAATAEAALQALGVSIPVMETESVQITATIRSPNGVVEISGPDSTQR